MNICDVGNTNNHDAVRRKHMNEYNDIIIKCFMCNNQILYKDAEWMAGCQFESPKPYCPKCYEVWKPWR